MPDELKDKVLKCVECGVDFTFSVREQQFWAEKKLAHDPKRCAPCRQKKRQRNAERPKQDMQRG